MRHDHQTTQFVELGNERYEKGATIITSNRAINEFPQVFGDPLLASAGLDRLLHNASVLVINGQSFRARNRNLIPTTKPAAEEPAIVT